MYLLKYFDTLGYTIKKTTCRYFAGPLHAPTPEAPKLLASPDKTLYKIGDTVILTCYTPLDAVQFQFYFNDVFQVGSSAHTWTRLNLNPTDSGQYYCRIVYDGTSPKSNYVEFTVISELLILISAINAQIVESGCYKTPFWVQI